MGRTKKYTCESNVVEKNNSISIEELNNINSIIDINSFKKKEKMLYDVLNDFFKKCCEDEIKTIIDVISGKYKISLRFLDWFVTRYCYLYKTSIQINNIYTKEQDFNINISYKAQLKSFKKKSFDPFKRKNKFYYSLMKNNLNYTVLTTLGQLNFFKWALTHDIIKYVENNFELINNKINYVNSFFKKNIIENTTSSIISSEELKSKSLNVESNSSNIFNELNIKNNISIDSSFKSNKKNSNSYNPIVSRKIYVEL